MTEVQLSGVPDLNNDHVLAPDGTPSRVFPGDWLYSNTEAFDGHAQIARIRPDGSDLQQLTYDDNVNWFPHLAPTGAYAW
jgi:Tol biopolymer transport system component